MFRTVRRPAARITRAATLVAAAVAVGAALTGCTVAVDGTPHPDPQPVALSAPQPTYDRAPRSTGSPLPPGLGEDLGPHAEVLRRWMADGWLPMPLLRQTDPATGVSAAMFGPVRSERSDSGSAYFTATGAPARILTTFGVVSSRPGDRIDGREAAERTAAKFGGRLVDHGPIFVDGRFGDDSTIDVRSPSGAELRQLIRRIELPGHVILIQAIGDRSETAKLEQIRDIVTSTIEVP
jgi:hypothetical protein